MRSACRAVRTVPSLPAGNKLFPIFAISHHNFAIPHDDFTILHRSVAIFESGGRFCGVYCWPVHGPRAVRAPCHSSLLWCIAGGFKVLLMYRAVALRCTGRVYGSHEGCEVCGGHPNFFVGPGLA